MKKYREFNYFQIIRYLLYPILFSIFIILITYTKYGFFEAKENVGYFSYNFISLTEDSFYWIFSSIFQGFLALLALLGSVAIFKVQSINKEIDIIVQNLRGLITNLKGSYIKTLPNKDVCKIILNIKEPKGEGDKRLIVNGKGNLVFLLFFLNKFKSKFIAFFVTTSITIIISLILMPCTNYLHAAKGGYVGLYVAIIIISLSISSIISAFYFVYEIFKD